MAVEARISKAHPLHEVISEAYRVFRYPKPNTLGVCQHCCMDPGIEKDFLTPDVQDLPLSYLRDWFNGGVDLEMPRGVWGYLLPRILEVLAAGEEPAVVGVEVSLNRFPTGDLTQWRADEWAVIDRFRREFLADRHIPDGCFLDDILCMFASAQFSVSDLFLRSLS